MIRESILERFIDDNINIIDDYIECDIDCAQLKYSMFKNWNFHYDNGTFDSKFAINQSEFLVNASIKKFISEYQPGEYMYDFISKEQMREISIALINEWINNYRNNRYRMDN